MQKLWWTYTIYIIISVQDYRRTTRLLQRGRKYRPRHICVFSNSHTVHKCRQNSLGLITISGSRLFIVQTPRPKKSIFAITILSFLCTKFCYYNSLHNNNNANNNKEITARVESLKTILTTTHNIYIYLYKRFIFLKQNKEKMVPP